MTRTEVEAVEQDRKLTATRRCPIHRTPYGYIGFCIKCASELHRKWVRAVINGRLS